MLHTHAMVEYKNAVWFHVVARLMSRIGSFDYGAQPPPLRCRLENQAFFGVRLRVGSKGLRLLMTP